MVASNFDETNYVSSTTAGMHALFAAFADTRYAVVAPIIGVQVHSVKARRLYACFCWAAKCLIFSVGFSMGHRQ